MRFNCRKRGTARVRSTPGGWLTRFITTRASPLLRFSSPLGCYWTFPGVHAILEHLWRSFLKDGQSLEDIFFFYVIHGRCIHPRLEVCLRGFAEAVWARL